MVKYQKDTVNSGDTLIAEIILGSSTKPVTNLYGLVFSLGLDPALFDINKTRIKTGTSFIGMAGSDFIIMNKNIASSGNMHIGICRINQMNTSGNGNIATLYMPVNSTLPQKFVKTSLPVFNNVQISYNERNVPLYFSSDSVILEQHNSGINNINSEQKYLLSVYPNPFNNKTSIHFTLPQPSHVKISIMDIKGNILFTPTDKTLNSGPNTVEINASEAGLSEGEYFVNIMINDQVISKKVVEVKQGRRRFAFLKVERLKIIALSHSFAIQVRNI